MACNVSDCPYGKKCYRKNPEHFKEFNHPHLDEPKAKKAKVEENKITDPEIELDKNSPEPNNESEEEKQSESETVEDDDKLDSTDISNVIKLKYKVAMPKDFFDFYEFAKSVNSKNPCDALNSINLTLVGPFEFLSGQYKRHSKKTCYLTYWRYYYDPPEFLTVVQGDKRAQFHIGYFRDDPENMPDFVAFNEAKNSCQIKPKGENLFAAIKCYIDGFVKENPIKKTHAIKILTDLGEYAKKLSYSLDVKTPKMKKRDKLVNSKTFHGAGICVPVDDNDIGYRPLPDTPGELKKILKKIESSEEGAERNKAFDPLMETIMCVQFANDECDYGQGLELGIDLFSYGSDIFHSQILNVLPLAYELLGRNEYGEIIKAHLKNRKVVLP
ncbi:DgyrCDS4097 [Dimorphilus gyrociliatus]|uniref:DgyrCDS4097 n=1 Tax=Dimorphilus gyrociliatus TaxID=2664684 RepID=A0A7I8VI15_9ANNE|nr:DgyrCDS4097 [Dimorphilus gyrociliatus]